MKQELKTLCIRRAVVKHVMQMLQENQIPLSNNTLFFEGIASLAEARQRGELGFLAGCIANDKFSLMHKVLVKQLRGNLVLQTKEQPHDEEDEKELEAKTIFTILIHGRAVREKVKLLCSSLGALMVECEEENAAISSSIKQMYSGLNSQTFRLAQIIANTKELLESELKVVSDNSLLWKGSVHREEMIYQTLNKLQYDANKRYLLGNCWCPTDDLPKIHSCVENIMRQSNSTFGPFVSEIRNHSLKPPTYIRTNRLTVGFQDLMDAYGIPRYKELNPAAFSVVTFPFLFAVMFGDIGHAGIMLFFALFLIGWERRISESEKPFFKNEIFLMAFNGRYILLLMGAFSLFTGLIYNDYFSLHLTLFASGWKFVGEKAIQVSVYPFGVDSAWITSTNALSFLNSYKMKQSILYGLAHMYFGIVLSGFNHSYFGEGWRIWCETIPQILFLSSIFGYLGVLILMKWCLRTEAHPSLLTTLIDMILNPFSLDKRDQLFPFQWQLQISLLVTAFVCMIWMLLARPIVQMRQVWLPVPCEEHLNNSNEEIHQLSPAPTSELFLNQAIHTIEFVLGSISNTASYLRLWALSLAHAQLSEVLWQMVMQKAHFAFAPLNWIIWMLWLVLTVGIMVVLEGLSAFLHSLRLHWVEFNNKFFVGEGEKFEPFCLREIK